MKRISDLLKPFLSVIFGALLFLCHFNWLSANGGYLALGIVAVVLAVYFVVVGLLGSALGDKFPTKTKELLNGIGVGVYPLFLGVYFLVYLIMCAKYEVAIGPMGWTIAIYSIAASIGLGVLFLLAFLTKKHFFIRISFLFSCLFVLVLLLDVLLTNGNPATLGSIVVLFVVLYGVYSAMLFNELKVLQADYKKTSKAKEEPKPEEEKK